MKLKILTSRCLRMCRHKALQYISLSNEEMTTATHRTAHSSPRLLSYNIKGLGHKRQCLEDMPSVLKSENLGYHRHLLRRWLLVRVGKREA